MKRLVPLLAVAALGGCLEEQQASEPVEPVDEEGQAAADAERTIKAFCAGRPIRARNLRARPRVPNRAAARDAVRRLRRLARRHAEATDVDNEYWHAYLADMATALERARCLPEEVPRIDRDIRRRPLPFSPEEEYVEDVPEEEMWP